MQRWYAARCKLQIPWETTINHLHQQEFTAWMPIVRSQSYQMGKKLIIETPLFGPYLFIQFDMTKQRWRAVNHTAGVARLLPTHAEYPEPVSVGFVEELQTRPTMAAVEDLITKTFASDALVKIVAGSFAGRFAKVLSSHRLATRVRVELFAGREVVTTVPTAALAAAAD